MWTPIAIVIFSLALVLGPVMWLRPSPYQRRIAKLRQRAVELGLRVALMPVPERAKLTEDIGSSMAVYYLPWEISGQNVTPAIKTLRQESASWRLVKEKMSHEINFSGNWDWSGNKKATEVYQPAVRDLLPSLNGGIICLENAPQGLMVYWDEKADDETGAEIVAQLYDLLSQLRQRLIAITENISTQ